MGTFAASLRSIGDVRSLPATVELADGHLSIVAGSTEIGSWALSEIGLEEIPTGYRMSAEGEQILLEIKDLDSFAAELETRTKKRFGRGKKKEDRRKPDKASAPASEVTSTPKVEAPRPSPTPTPAPVSASGPTTATRKKEAGSGLGTKVLSSVDNILIKAKKRFGAYLPDFMFSRAMFVLAIVALLVMLLLPGLFSVLLLVAGALTVLFGAVVYSDSVLASRWLPGRATPQQALLLGLGVLVLGVLLGMFAK